MPHEPELFPGLRHPFAVLTSEEISASVNSGRLIIDRTFDESSLQAATYDVRAGRYGIIGGQGKELDLLDDTLVIDPGSYAGLVSFEKIKLPNNVMALIGAKRKFSYEGVILLTGSVVDPGYEGHLLFGLYNASTKKVVIPSRTKICSMLFIELDKEQKPVAPDSSLLSGTLPGDFVNKMANMDVLPWSRISEEVKQIQRLTQDVLDLKVKYTDVLEPIKALTINIDKVNTEVGLLTRELKTLGGDVHKLEKVTSENAHQVSDIAASVKLLTIQVVDVKDRQISGESKLHQIDAKVGSYSIVAKVVWAVIFLLVTILLTVLITAHFSK